MVHSECVVQSNSAFEKTDHECANALVLREIVGKENNIAVLKLNRTKRLNALCEQLIDELLAALEEYDKNENIKVIVITGSDRVFSAGADIKEMCTKSFAEITKTNFPSNWSKITALNKPLIAAVNGFAFGGGFELALMCDIVYASESALFAQPEITIGTIPGAGGTQRLTRIAGKSLAMEMCLTGDKMSAIEAKEYGIVSKVFPGEVLLEETIKLAEKIARNSSLIISIVKESVNNAYETTLQQGLATERKLFHSTFATDDIKEGMKAFIEKRSPKWSNQ